MKKTILCGIALVAGLWSCTEDYTDWASPQQNGASEAAQKLEMTLQPTIQSIDFANYTAETVQLFTTNLSGEQADGFTAVIGGEGLEQTVTLTTDAEGNVATGKLEEAVNTLYGSNPKERILTITVSTIATNATADGPVKVQRQARPFTLKAKLQAPYIDENGYYVVGNIDGWTSTRVDAFHMVNNGGDIYDNPEFSVTIDAVEGVSTYEIKMVPAADFNAGGTIDSWNRAFSAPAGTDKVAYEGQLSNVNAGGNIKFAADEDAASYTITVNAMTSTYTVEPNMAGNKTIIDTDPMLYLTGDHYNWGGGDNGWIPLIPVLAKTWEGETTTNTSWIIIYLHEGEQFKFAPQAGWGNDFGMSAKIVDNAGMNPSGDNNIVVGNAGWYLIKVYNGEERIVEFLKPEVYLMGDCCAAGWNLDASSLFTIPTTEKEKFVSPAFVKDAEVRMCVSLEGFEWWQTEFIVTPDGAIDFRASGGDQARVKVSAGQQCTLNFTNGTGKYK